MKRSHLIHLNLNMQWVTYNIKDPVVDLFDGCDAMDNIPDGRDLMKGSLIDGSDEVELQMKILE